MVAILMAHRKAGHTIAQWHVDDIESEVRDLKTKGIRFEVYDDMPGVTWDGEIASLRLGLGEVATRDWIRSELQDLVKELEEQREVFPSDDARARDVGDR